VLDERHRDGVAIEVCPACRGVWLDRGELETLIARSTRDDDDDDDDDRPWSSAPGADLRPERDGADRGGRRPRKRRWFESFGDLFD
jgi:Zn-finger nucleic acid-binding protein